MDSLGGYRVVSLFKQIYSELESKILHKEYESGSLLPSEHQLADYYNVSRETIRKSLNLLQDRGYIQKVQGKGSLVLDMKRTDLPIAGLTSYKEVQESHQLNSDTKVIANELIPAPKDIAQQLEIEVGAPVHQLIRVREVDGEAIILDYDYLNAEYVKELPTERMTQSLYDYIEQDLGYHISYATKEFTVESASADDYNYLTLHQDQNVVVTRSKIYFEDTTLFQYTESRHRVDKFRYVEFARRKTI